MWDHLTDLQHRPPRHGLSSATAEFVDHLVELFGRYAEHLFVCFDDTGIPATTNGLEGFFGQIKRMIRKALGAGSTTNSVVGNLGAEFLIAWQQVRRSAKGKQFPWSIDLPAYQKARAELEALEQPARQRRSFLRDPGHHLLRLLDRWLSSH